jgi:hypothetical protein
MLFWLSVVLEERGGIDARDSVEAADRRPGRFGSIRSHNPSSPDHLRPQRDMLHVPRRCQELDRDGVTAGIWRDLQAVAREKFPAEAEAWIRDLAPADEPLEAQAVKRDPINGPVSAAELARKLGLSVDAVDSFLRRYRKRNWECCVEVPADYRSRRQPKILYHPAKVLPALRERYNLTDE